MRTVLVWLLMCTSLVADDIMVNNAVLLTTHHETGYVVEATIWRPHGSGLNIITSGDQWSIAFADEKARKQFFDLNDPLINRDITIRDKVYSTAVDVVGTQVLNIYGKTLIIKSLHKSGENHQTKDISKHLPPLRLKPILPR